MDKPVLPKESGFVREFTNMFLLENVEFVPELLLKSEEEYRFYMELKRRTGKVIENEQNVSGFELGNIKVLFDEGEIQVYKDGRAVGNCAVSEFSRHPSATFRRLQGYFKDLHE